MMVVAPDTVKHDRLPRSVRHAQRRSAQGISGVALPVVQGHHRRAASIGDARRANADKGREAAQRVRRRARRHAEEPRDVGLMVENRPFEQSAAAPDPVDRDRDRGVSGLSRVRRLDARADDHLQRADAADAGRAFLRKLLPHDLHRHERHDARAGLHHAAQLVRDGDGDRAAARSSSRSSRPMRSCISSFRCA